MLAAFRILFAAKLAAKLDWSDTLSKLRIYTLEVMLSNIKKFCIIRFSSAGLTVLQPYSLPLDPLAMIIQAQFFLTMQVLITFVLIVIACPLIVHSIDCANELVATNHQTLSGINHKDI